MDTSPPSEQPDDTMAPLPRQTGPRDGRVEVCDDIVESVPEVLAVSDCINDPDNAATSNIIESVSVSDELAALIGSTKGFMPADEGAALRAAALAAGAACPGLPWLEVGSYCGKSALWLGDAARLANSVLFAVDHHRGSEENQAGWEHHDTDVVDARVGKMDTLPFFRQAVHNAGLEPWVIAVVGQSPTVAAHWGTPLGFVFIDGGHGREPAQADYAGWTPHVAVGGTLAIHDVFPNPDDGGRPPYEDIYLPAINSGQFVEVSVTGSLRILQRV